MANAAYYNPMKESGAVYQKVRGLTLNVLPFYVGGFAFDGGEIDIVSAGKWYVGVDLFTREVIALPRLGHRGWIPVAEVDATASAISSIYQIQPKLPKSRLPKTIKKLLAGQAIKVLVMGSSLAEGTSTTYWAGMVFGGGDIADYKVPGAITLNNFALGGAPNLYQLAQCGLASTHITQQYQNAGYPRAFQIGGVPNGRSTMFDDTDLVVLTCLANGGDYRLEMIEPIIRQMRKRGVEVLVTSDNPQGAGQVGGTGPYIWAGGYTSVTNAALHSDGPYLKRICDKYQVEFADTSAYVVDAVLRYPESSIYRDSIHMFAGEPAGRTGQPSGGYEVWARAIRSCIPVDAEAIGTVVLSTGFDTIGVLDGWTKYNDTYANVSNPDGSLHISKKSASSGQWGGRIFIPPVNIGDTVTVSVDVTFPEGSDWAGNGKAPSVGLNRVGWASNSVPLIVGGVATSGHYDIELTVTQATTGNDMSVLFFGNWDGAPLGFEFIIDNVEITVNSSYESNAYEVCAGIEYENQLLPENRIVTDMKTPGDAFVILPSQEFNYALSVTAYKGTLGAHPQGANSFARKFNTAIGASSDLLTVVTGNRFSIAGNGVVGFSLIYYAVNGDAACVFDVYVNNVFQKTVTIPAATITREIVFPITTPTALGKSTPLPFVDVIECRVTSGTLRIAALIAQTFDITYLPAEHARFIGTWVGRVAGGNPNMSGYGTDVATDYAVARCPPDGRRLAWVISSKPQSQPVSTYDGVYQTASEATAGTNHIGVKGNHVGPGTDHYIRLESNQENADHTNGYGLHIGGILVTNDR